MLAAQAHSNLQIALKHIEQPFSETLAVSGKLISAALSLDTEAKNHENQLSKWIKLGGKVNRRWPLI